MPTATSDFVCPRCKAKIELTRLGLWYYAICETCEEAVRATSLLALFKKCEEWQKGGIMGVRNP